MLLHTKIVLASYVIWGSYYVDSPLELSETILLLAEDYEEERCNAFVK